MKAHIQSYVLTALLSAALTRPFAALAQRPADKGADPVNLANPPLVVVQEEYAPDEVLVAFQPGFAAGQAEAARQALGAVRIKVFAPIGVHNWRLPPGLDVAKAIQILSANPNVRYAEPNYLVHAHALPDDPLRAELWGLHNVRQTGGTLDADIDALETWELATGSPTVVVAVIDTGIDYNHEDLAANIWTNPGEIPGDGLDNDGNGYIDDVRGWDWSNHDNDPMDDHGHGSHVSGTIGAVGNNGVGVVGVNWQVKLMALKFLNASGNGSVADAVSATLYANAFGVPVLNNSWGGPRSRAHEDAIQASTSLVVCSAGNSGSSSKNYPAAYAQPNVVAVAATDHNDALASFSTYGSWVHLAAPGVQVLSCTRNNTYQRFNGTSMASPHVAGVAALIKAQTPGLSATAIKSQILNHVEVLAWLAGKTSTSGRLSARKALGAPEFAPDSQAPAQIADLTAASVSIISVILTWSAPDDDGNVGTAYAYDLRYRTEGPVTEANWASAALATGGPIPGPNGQVESFAVTGLDQQTTYYFAIKAIDEAGNASLISNSPFATTESTGWDVQTVEAGSDLGRYISLALGPSGNPALAYNYDTSSQPFRQLKFARFSGISWNVETVMDGGGGASLAFNAAGAPAISHVASSRLYFVVKSGATWNSTLLEKNNVWGDVTSLAYDSWGNPAISYGKLGSSGGLMLARLGGATWTRQVVDPGAAARYNAAAFDPAGNPAIAYSDDPDGDGWLSALKFAHWNGASWDIQIIEAGAKGDGVFATFAYDPLTGLPAFAHAGIGQIRFVRWNGTGWQSEVVDPTTTYTAGCALSFAADGTAYLAYGADYTQTRSAQRNPTTGLWTVELIDSSPTVSSSFLLSQKIAPDGLPIVGYNGAPVGSAADSVRVAWKAAP